jgi:hypothetical protein
MRDGGDPLRLSVAAVLPDLGFDLSQSHQLPLSSKNASIYVATTATVYSGGC